MIAMGGAPAQLDPTITLRGRSALDRHPGREADQAHAEGGGQMRTAVRSDAPITENLIFVRCSIE